MLVVRGVFQSLVEKHFPAPDRRKMFDLLTLGTGTGASITAAARFDSSESPLPSPISAASAKRKLDSFGTLR